MGVALARRDAFVLLHENPGLLAVSDLVGAVKGQLIHLEREVGRRAQLFAGEPVLLPLELVRNVELHQLLERGRRLLLLDLQSVIDVGQGAAVLDHASAHLVRLAHQWQKTVLLSNDAVNVLLVITGDDVA